MKNVKLCSVLLLLVLSLSIILTGCGQKNVTETDKTNVSSVVESVFTTDTELGEGSKTVYVKVTDDKNNTITFTIHTDEDYLGAALINNGVIKGDNGQYGLYITHVNGLEANYEKDKSYWGFYKNGEYMMTGVDQTKFEDGETYELVYVKE